jgi:hypothetical protein
VAKCLRAQVWHAQVYTLQVCTCYLCSIDANQELHYLKYGLMAFIVKDKIEMYLPVIHESHGSVPQWFRGQRFSGSHGSYVILRDPLPAHVLYRYAADDESVTSVRLFVKIHISGIRRRFSGGS